MRNATPLFSPLRLVAPVPNLPVAATPARHLFSSLECWLSSPAALGLPLHAVERQQEHKDREVQRLLLEAHIRQRGTGDSGPALRVVTEGSSSIYTHRRVRRRSLVTIFGPVDIDRTGYSRNGAAAIHPLDAAMQLPARSFSYELQKRLVKAAVQGPFRESTERLLDHSGLTVHKRSLEQILPEAALDFDLFYARPLAETSPATATILVAAVDCKGIPMVRPDRAKHSDGKTGKHQARRHKTGRKKMATVAAVFTRLPWVRTPQQVVDSLFGTPETTQATEPPPRPENKRIWASLIKSKESVIDQVAEEVRRRDPQGCKVHVAITDGERALQNLVGRKLKVILILDLLHVLEKVWKAAHVFHPEGSPDAEVYARLMTHRILEGNVGQVVKGLRQTVTKRKLFGAKKKALLAVAGYFHNNRQRMRYHEYLAQGLPIASGSVEGACKNLIKDRMERSGMRWTQAMAESIIRLRALYLSGHFDAYWDFHIVQDQLRLHPQGRWTVVAK